MKRIVTVAAIVAVVGLLSAACSDEGNVFSLEVGDCFDDPGFGSQVSDVPIVECSQPHDNEVYAVFESPDGSLPPVSEFEQGCLDRFDSYFSASYATSEIYAGYFSPSDDSWADGDRETICYGYVPGERTRGATVGLPSASNRPVPVALPLSFAPRIRGPTLNSMDSGTLG